MFQLYQQKYMYISDPVNLVTWLLYIFASVMVTPIFWGSVMSDMQFSFTSLTVFLSWFNLLLLLQRFDQVGIYVVMFLEILQTLIKVLMVFSMLIIAFGLAFYILLSRVSRIFYQLKKYFNPLTEELIIFEIFEVHILQNIFRKNTNNFCEKCCYHMVLVEAYEHVYSSKY